MKIGFLVSVGSEVGLGHWIRSIALSKAILKSISGSQVFWVAQQDVASELKNQAMDAGIEVIEVSEVSSSTLSSTLLAQTPQLVVFDWIDLSSELVKSLNSRVHTLCIGGSGEGRSFVETRIDAMIPRESYNANFFGTNYFYGAEYIILRPEYSESKPVEIRDGLQRIFVCLGYDSKGVGFKISAALLKIFPDVVVDLVIGDPSVQLKLEDSRLNFYSNLERPHKLMKESDLAITAGGISASEALCLGLPLLLVPMNLPQLEASSEIEKQQAARCLGAYDEISNELAIKLEQAVRPMFSKEVRLQLQSKAHNLIDGQGLDRTLQICRTIIEGA